MKEHQINSELLERVDETKRSSIRTMAKLGFAVPWTGWISAIASTSWLAAVAVVFQPWPVHLTRGDHDWLPDEAAVVSVRTMPSVLVAPMDCMSVIGPDSSGEFV